MCAVLLPTSLPLSCCFSWPWSRETLMQKGHHKRHLMFLAALARMESMERPRFRGTEPQRPVAWCKGSGGLWARRSIQAGWGTSETDAKRPWPLETVAPTHAHSMTWLLKTSHQNSFHLKTLLTPICLTKGQAGLNPAPSSSPTMSWAVVGAASSRKKGHLF